MTEAECRNIYRNVFRDPDTGFEDMLFGNCFEYIRTLEVGGSTVSMLFLLPIELPKNGIKGAYLYAAATIPEYRKNGYMATLINNALKEYGFILLRPASDALIDYYSKFGFKAVEAGNFSSCTEICPAGGYKNLIELSGVSDNNEQFTAMYYSNIPLELKKIKFNYSMN